MLGALIGGGMALSGLASGLAGSSAMGDAASDARGQARQTAALYAPWRDEGLNALMSLSDFQFDPNDPAYAWRLEQGEEGINQSLAARGLHGSRAGINALSDLRSRLTQEEYGNQYGRAYNLANMGLQATGGMAGARAAIPGYTMQEGQSRAGMYAGIPGMLGSSMMGGYYGGQLFGGGGGMPGAGGGDFSGLASFGNTGSGLGQFQGSGGR